MNFQIFEGEKSKTRSHLLKHPPAGWLVELCHVHESHRRTAQLTLFGFSYRICRQWKRERSRRKTQNGPTGESSRAECQSKELAKRFGSMPLLTGRAYFTSSPTRCLSSNGDARGRATVATRSSSDWIKGHCHEREEIDTFDHNLSTSCWIAQVPKRDLVERPKWRPEEERKMVERSKMRNQSNSSLDLEHQIGPIWLMRPRACVVAFHFIRPTKRRNDYFCARVPADSGNQRRFFSIMRTRAARAKGGGASRTIRTRWVENKEISRSISGWQ